MFSSAVPILGASQWLVSRRCIDVHAQSRKRLRDTQEKTKRCNQDTQRQARGHCSAACAASRRRPTRLQHGVPPRSHARRFFRCLWQLRCDAVRPHGAWARSVTALKTRKRAGEGITLARTGAPCRMSTRTRPTQASRREMAGCCDRLQRCARTQVTARTIAWSPDGTASCQSRICCVTGQAPGRSCDRDAGAGPMCPGRDAAHRRKHAVRIGCMRAIPAGRARRLGSASADEFQENPSKDNSIAITNASSRPLLEG